MTDFSELSIGKIKRSQAIKPEDIFKSLTLRGSVENIWGPQDQALKEWDQKRKALDIVIDINTGGGKTLVGLIIAQSLVNETKGRVTYVCPNNQLVEQVVEKAKECGFEVASYAGGNWLNREIYESCTGACITNYAAVFNSRSIFRDHDLKGIIFDDAHVAHNLIRERYTIKIGSDEPAYNEVANLFNPHFIRNSQGYEFQSAIDGDYLALLFVPMFEVRQQRNKLGSIFKKHKITDSNNKFAWEYLKDHLDRCVIFISGSSIEITPPLLPIPSLPYFQSSVRRIYLTATIPSKIEFLRTFGSTQHITISPGGKSGEAQRQFIFLTGEDSAKQRELAKNLIKDEKACIITPSNYSANDWTDVGNIFDRGKGNADIDSFKKSSPPVKLILPARFDGIDLPGKTCKVLVLDGLPTGFRLLDKFMDQTLRIEKIRTSHTAIRIIQAIGRIFRSNSDHGVVLICGDELRLWLIDPNNRKYMPSLLQKQIQLGIRLRDLVGKGKLSFQELLKAVLEGDKTWDEFYNKTIDEFEIDTQPPESAQFISLILSERSAFNKLWQGNYKESAQEYESLAQDARPFDTHLSAWYHHFAGCSYDLSSDSVNAIRNYILAVNERSELGRPSFQKGIIQSAAQIKPSEQGKRILTLIQKLKGKYLSGLVEIKKLLVYDGSSNILDQALCDLGNFLGLEATRPDNEVKTGPDVLWRYKEIKRGSAFETKTNKKEGSEYHKNDDIAQFHSHSTWLEKEYPDEAYEKVIIGRKLPVSQHATPDPQLKIITLDQFIGLVDRLIELYNVVISVTLSDEQMVILEQTLGDIGLNFPKCIESLESYLATDLKKSNITTQEPDLE